MMSCLSGPTSCGNTCNTDCANGDKEHEAEHDESTPLTPAPVSPITKQLARSKLQDTSLVFTSQLFSDVHAEPLKVILFIAAAEGVHHQDIYRGRDPHLSEKGLRQCRIVQKQLANAQQCAPAIMLCSSLRRSLETCKNVCSEWYGKTPFVVLDELRPPIGTHISNRRSSITSLAKDFEFASFKYTEGIMDIFWEDEEESNEKFMKRVFNFVEIQLKELECRRVVIISHRRFLHTLFCDVVQSTIELRSPWKHCDLRKVFIYERKQVLQSKAYQKINQENINLSKAQITPSLTPKNSSSSAR